MPATVGCFHDEGPQMLYCEKCAARLEFKAALSDELAAALRKLTGVLNGVPFRYLFLEKPMLEADAVLAKCEASKKG